MNIEATEKGFTVALANPIEGAQATANFFSDLEKEGFWYALTDKHFGEWFVDTLHALAEALVNYSDIAIIIVMILALFALFGSKKALNYIYWTFATYLIIKVLGSYL